MGVAGGHLSYWLNVDLEDADWCLLCLIQAERISPGVLAKKKKKYAGGFIQFDFMY